MALKYPIEGCSEENVRFYMEKLNHEVCAQTVMLIMDVLGENFAYCEMPGDFEYRALMLRHKIRSALEDQAQLRKLSSILREMTS